MQLALRPYATAGVALVGASVIAVSPVIATPTAIEVRDRAVELSALTNPIDVFGPIFEQTLKDLRDDAQAIAANPAPVLTQVIKNQIRQIGQLPAGIRSQIGAALQLPQLLPETISSEVANLEALGGLGQQFLTNVIGAFTNGDVQTQIQAILDAAQTDGFGAAFTQLALLPVLVIGGGNGIPNLFNVLPALTPLLQQPLADAAKLFPIVAGPLGNAEAAIGVVANSGLSLGVGALVPLLATGMAIGNTLDGLIDAARDGDPEIVFNTVVEQSGALTKAALDAVFSSANLGLVPTLQTLREAIATAIAPQQAAALVAKAPNSATVSFTLAKPLEKAPEPKALNTSGDEKTGSVADDAGAAPKDASGTPTSTNTKDGNLFTPGTNTAKGGRHRADTGSFAQGLKDAAEKTIKGLTGLGRDKEAEGASATSTSGESDSSGSGSGSTSSDGGTAGK